MIGVGFFLGQVAGGRLVARSNWCSVSDRSTAGQWVVVLEWAEDRGRRLLLLLPSDHHHNFCNHHEPDDVCYESNPDRHCNPNDKPNSDSAYYRGNCDNHRDRDAIHKHLNSDGQ